MMNGVQTLIAGMTTQATAAGTMQGGASGGAEQAANGSAFAALVASLLGGEAMPAKAQELSILSLFAGGTSESVETTEGATDEEAALEAVLSQLAAWIGSLSPELQQKIAADPKVAEWMSMTEAELAMSNGDGLSTMIRSGAEDEPATTANAEQKPLSELLDRLIRSLDAEADQPYLAAAAKQASVVVAHAAAALETLEAGSIPGLPGARTTNSPNGAETNAKAQTTAPSEIASLLSKSNGKIETNAATKPEPSNANARWSHLSAMQAKSVLVRVASAETPPTTIAVESGVATASESASNGTEGMPTSNLSDAVKGAQAIAAKSPEAAPRMPLAEAAERLNEWVLKQSSIGGNLKAETVLKLMPEHLGQVEVKLTMTNGQLTASITTESLMAKEALESNLAALRSSLQNQGVTVERLVVSQQQPSGFQSGMFQEGRQQRQPAGRDGARDERGQGKEDAEDWAEVLSVSAEQEAAALDNYGTSFRAEA